jgi:RAD50-interacting protein 1
LTDFKLLLTRGKLDEANTDLKKATEALHEHNRSIQSKAEAFHEQQSDIDQRLLEITEGKTSDDAVKMFESSMGKLRRLDLATGYLQLLQEVDSLGYNGKSYFWQS